MTYNQRHFCARIHKKQTSVHRTGACFFLLQFLPSIRLHVQTADIHPGLKTIPLDMEREFTVPYGLMIANDPSPAVKRFISAIERVEGIRPHNGNATASR